MVNKRHAQDTIRRMQAAVAREDPATLNAIVEALSEEQAKFLVTAMAMSMFEVI